MDAALRKLNGSRGGSADDGRQADSFGFPAPDFAHGSVTPEPAVGATMQDDDRGYAAVTFTVGQVFRSDDQLVLPMRLLGANPDADPALIGTALDRQALRVGAELRVARASGLEVRVGYSAELSDEVHNHTAGVSLKMPF